jgi:TM2 domain-containing membrane protein YozV
VTLSAVPEFAAVLREVLPPPPSASQAAYVQPLAAYGPPSIPHGAPMAFAPAPQVIYVQAPALYRPTKSRAAYVLLGLFLGPLGIHNFYAGYAGRAVVQLLITLALGWMLGVPIVLVWIWNLIEVVAVTKDAAGYRFA